MLFLVARCNAAPDLSASSLIAEDPDHLANFTAISTNVIYKCETNPVQTYLESDRALTSVMLTCLDTGEYQWSQTDPNCVPSEVSCLLCCGNRM